MKTLVLPSVSARPVYALSCNPLRPLTKLLVLIIPCDYLMLKTKKENSYGDHSIFLFSACHFRRASCTQHGNKDTLPVANRSRCLSPLSLGSFGLYVFVHVYTYMSLYVHINKNEQVHTYIPTYLPACLPTCLPT